MAEYSAEFGGKSGAVINVTTRGGSNKLHGKVYEFIRNDFFEARNYVAPTGVLTPFHENQFGAVLDGPIVKNRTFFMASYDGERLRQTLSQLYSVPTAAQRAGNLAGLSAVRDPLTGVAVSGNNLNNDPNFSTSNPSTAAALALLNLLPLPTGAGNASNLQGIAPKSIDMNQYSARIDHRFGANDTAFVRASYVDPNERDPFGSNALNETLLPGFGRILRSPSTNVVASESHAFSPKFINEARASWLIVTGGQKDPNAGNPFASSYGLRGTTSNLADVGYPQVGLSGLFSTIGTATGFNTRVDHNFEITDNVTLIRGRHEIKLGGYFFHLAFQPSFPNNARGTYTFNGAYSGNALADFLFGYPSQGQVGIGEGAENAHTNWMHAYVQDGWRISPRLKFDLGLRYEFNSNLAARPNQTSDIDLSSGVARFVVSSDPSQLTGNAAVLAALAAAQTPPIPIVSNTDVHWDSSLLTTRPLRLSPRMGVTWQVPHVTDALLRAGFGVFTNQAAYSVWQTLAENIPFFLNKTVNNSASTPTFTTANILAANPNGAIGANSANHDFKIEYNEVWNLSLQKSLSSYSAFTITYAGSRTVHADSSTAVNFPTPGPGAVQARRPFSNLNSFTTIRWDGWASFHGLTLQLTTRKLHGLSFDGAYTWSHSIDDASDAGATNAEFNLPQNIYAHNLAVEKASSSFDHRNRFVGNALYELPACASCTGWKRGLTQGWQVSSVAIVQGGAPFTVNLGPSNDAANIGLVNGNNIQRPNISGDPNSGPRTPGKWFNTAAFSVPSAYTFGNTPRNAIIGPSLINFDVALQKELVLHEDVRLQLRADSYNVANRPNFNLPGRIFGATNFGVISGAADPREIQFVAKLTFY